LEKDHRKNYTIRHIRQLHCEKSVGPPDLSVPFQNNAGRYRIRVENKSVHAVIFPLNPVQGQKVMRGMKKKIKILI
jgi:hypothetical protein